MNAQPLPARADKIPILLLKVSLSGYGTSRKADLDLVTTEADKDRLALAKRLLVFDERQAINTLDGEIRNWFTKRSIPSEFQRGTYRINPTKAEEMIAQVLKYQAQRADLVQKITPAIYRQAIIDDRTRLRDQFNPRNYPLHPALIEKFSMEYAVFTMETPAGMMDYVSAETFKTLKENLGRSMDAAREAGVERIRRGFKLVLDKFVERMTPDQEGNRKRFQKGTLDNIREMLETFEYVNIGDDQQLAAMMDDTRKLMDGLTPDQLRKSDQEATYYADKIQTIAENVGSMIEDAPRRKFRPEAI